MKEETGLLKNKKKVCTRLSNLIEASCFLLLVPLCGCEIRPFFYCLPFAFLRLMSIRIGLSIPEARRWECCTQRLNKKCRILPSSADMTFPSRGRKERPRFLKGPDNRSGCEDPLMRNFLFRQSRNGLVWMEEKEKRDFVVCCWPLLLLLLFSLVGWNWVGH